MGNLIGNLKKLIVNKTTVTLLGLVICFVIIFVSYNRRVNSSINPIELPYAKVKIASGVQITSKMVGITKVPPSMLEGDVITNASNVIDKYSNADTFIPKGSLFYKRTVVEREELPANIILDYPTGYVLYNMQVDSKSTYGNAVYPGNYIDLYLKIQVNSDSSDGKITIAKFLSNIKVIAVQDEGGGDVFADPENPGISSRIIFAVPEEYYILLKKAEYLKTYKASLIPVPTNEGMKEEAGDLEMTGEELKKWINERTYWVD